MISNETLNAALPLAESLNARGIYLDAHPNSLLAACVSAATLPSLYNAPSESYVKDWAESLNMPMPINGTTNVSIDSDGDDYVNIDTTEHTATMNDCMNIMVDSTLRAMDHARNVARPIISNCIDVLSQQFQDSLTTKEPYEIIDVNIHAAWNDPIIMNALSRFKNLKIDVVPRSDIPRLTPPENLDNAMRTGSSSLDAIAYSLLEFTNQTWTQVFNNLFNSNNSVGAWPSTDYMVRNDLLLQFLLVEYLIDNPVPNSNLGTGEWKTMCYGLGNALGGICSALYTSNQSKEENNLLLLSIDGDKIYLHGGVYNKFLDAGGTPECIFGAMMRDTSGAEIDYARILSDMPLYENNWRAYHSAKRISDQNKYEARLHDSLCASVIMAAENLEASYLPPEKTTADIIDTAVKIIKDLRIYDTENTGDMVTDIICKSFFPHTPALQLLRLMNHYLNEGSDVNEAENLTAQTYMTYWAIGSLIKY